MHATGSSTRVLPLKGGTTVVRRVQGSVRNVSGQRSGVPNRSWSRSCSAAPYVRSLAAMVPDVEALLVNRARGARSHWLVPIDDCYGLVGLMRTHWRGFTGGRELWEELERFFAELDAKAMERR